LEYSLSQRNTGQAETSGARTLLLFAAPCDFHFLQFAQEEQQHQKQKQQQQGRPAATTKKEETKAKTKTKSDECEKYQSGQHQATECSENCLRIGGLHGKCKAK